MSTVGKHFNEQEARGLIRAIFGSYLSRNVRNLKRILSNLFLEEEILWKLREDGYLKFLEFGPSDNEKHFERRIN